MTVTATTIADAGLTVGLRQLLNGEDGTTRVRGTPTVTHTRLVYPLLLSDIPIGGKRGGLANTAKGMYTPAFRPTLSFCPSISLACHLPYYPASHLHADITPSATSDLFKSARTYESRDGS